MRTKKITEHFSYPEFERSRMARQLNIDNTMPEEVKENIRLLVQCVLEPARIVLGAPITVSSGYRCAALNAAVGGVPNSQHQTGQAADLQCFENGKFSVSLTRKLFGVLSDMDVDQLLYEHDSKGNVWIHVSFVGFKQNRHMIRDNYIFSRK